MPRIFKTSVVKPLISGIIQAHDNFLNEWQDWHRFTYNYEIKDLAEFYARLTELYFENPLILKNNDQKLYNILLSIYRYEPTPIRFIKN
jgi:Mlc titration factor MtfA (ptsG expression regulator)